MGLEENAQRELDQRDSRLRDALRAELTAQQKSFRGEMRVLFVLFLAANQAANDLHVGLEIATVAGGFVSAMYLLPKFLNR